MVSLGVDAYKDDPISFFKLDSPDFTDAGRRIAGLGLPTVFCMEGGYAIEAVGVNTVNVLEGFEMREVAIAVTHSPVPTMPPPPTARRPCPTAAAQGGQIILLPELFDAVLLQDRMPASSIGLAVRGQSLGGPLRRAGARTGRRAAVSFFESAGQAVSTPWR